jgi:flagellar hook-basal body complex protein FliE
MGRTAAESRLSSKHLCLQTSLEFSLMDVTLKPFNFAQAAARAGLGVNGLPLASSAQGARQVTGAGFQQQFAQALRSVSDSQNQATEMQRQVQLGNPTVSLEETMVAMQKAQIGFQATLQVRNKLVQAYSEIMNMQV